MKNGYKAMDSDMHVMEPYDLGKNTSIKNFSTARPLDSTATNGISA